MSETISNGLANIWLIYSAIPGRKEGPGGYLSDPNNYDYQSQIYTHCTASFDITNGKALTGFIIDAGKNEINSFELAF